MAPGGVPDADMDELAEYGFNFVTAHLLEKGAFYGMNEVGRHTLRDKNTVFCDTHDMSLPDLSYEAGAFQTDFDEDWLGREKRYWQGYEHPYLGKVE